MATFIEIDGTKTELTPRDPKRGFSLEELYVLLGCQLVEVVYLPGRRVMVLDEEGKLERPPREINVEATQLARAHGRLLRGDVIVGCGCGSWGGRCLSMGDYVRLPGPTDGVAAAREG